MRFIDTEIFHYLQLYLILFNIMRKSELAQEENQKDNNFSYVTRDASQSFNMK